MDYDEIEAPQYYALLFYRWDYTDLRKRLTKKGKIGVVRRNYILLKHSQAAEYIGRLTDKQRVLFNDIIKIRTQRLAVALVPILLIPERAKLLLHSRLNDNPQWIDERKVAVETAEAARREYNPSFHETRITDDATLDVLKRNSKTQWEKESESPVVLEKTEPQSNVIDWDDPAVLHEISATECKWKGWVSVTVRMFKDFKGRKPTNAERERMSCNIRIRVKTYREKHGLYPPKVPE